jgi:LmbE family N-acetylglucosaminyl deacetylase
MKRQKNTVLVIAAHPDDEVLGAGGTIAWHSRMKRDDVYVLMVTEGCTTQYGKKDFMIKQKKEEAIKAGSILGVKEVFFEDLPDMKLDSLSHTRINSAIEKYVEKVKPDLVFTQHPDINKDHVLVFESTMVALRPVPGLSVKKVLSYAPASSTEWSAPFSGNYFMPNVFYDISETLDLKLEAFSCYQSEMREFPHPRSLEAIRTYATQVGVTVGLRAAEPFMLMRAIEK